MYVTIKRWLDVFFSLLGGLICLPLLIALVLAIKLDSKGPVLFRQKRVGAGKTFFSIYKFRTMRVDTPHDMPTHLLSDPEQWITPVGRFLRRTSLDELPQLFNILTGDMSFIGPRPALWNQDDLVAARAQYRGRFDLTPNDVRPGLTGWAQINGRDELSIEDKARRDGEYVERFGFWMDVRCFFGTILSVLKGSGVREGATQVSRAPRVAIVSVYFQPEISPVTHLYADLASDLARSGADVTVVCGVARRGLDEETYRAYLSKTDETTPDGYRILRVGSKKRESRGLLGRGLGLLGDTLWLYRAAKKLHADAYLLGSMPPFLGLIGARLARSARTVYILQDIFPDSLVAMGKFSEGSPLVRLCRWMERVTYRKNTRFVTLTDDMKQTLLARGVNADRLSVIPNWADTERVSPVPRAENALFDELHLSRDGFYAVYAGTLGVLQEPDTLLDAAAILQKQAPEIRFVLFGGGALYAHVAARIEAENLSNTRLFPLLDEARTAEVYSLGDVSLIPLKAGTTRFAMPSKTWTSLSAGRPVIAAAEAGSAFCSLLSEAQIGAAFEPGSGQAMAEAILSFYADPSLCKACGLNARRFAVEQRQRASSTAAYHSLLCGK